MDTVVASNFDETVQVVKFHDIYYSKVRRHKPDGEKSFIYTEMTEKTARRFVTVYNLYETPLEDAWVGAVTKTPLPLGYRKYNNLAKEIARAIDFAERYMAKFGGTRIDLTTEQKQSIIQMVLDDNKEDY